MRTNLPVASLAAFATLKCIRHSLDRNFLRKIRISAVDRRLRTTTQDAQQHRLLKLRLLMRFQLQLPATLSSSIGSERNIDTVWHRNNDGRCGCSGNRGGSHASVLGCMFAG